MQQFHRSALPGGQTEGRLLERRVCVAFVNAPTALPARPEPRAAFDNAARKDNPSTPWRAFGMPLRATCAAASRLGGPTIDATRDRVLRAVLAFTAWVLEPLDDGVAVSTLLYAQLMREQAEALEAQALAHGLGTDAARAQALRETEEAIHAQRLYCATLTEPARWSSARGSITYRQTVR